MVTRFVVAVLCLIAAQFVAAAPALAKAKPFIELMLETDEAFLGDTIIVEVRWSGLLDPVDFAPLSRDADIVRETAGTRIAVIQGEVVEIASRRIELQPQRVGRLALGPLTAGDLTSNSVSIDITEPVSLDWSPGPQDIRLSQSISQTDPYLQQQLVFDIELRTRHPLVEETVTLPSLEGFRTVPIFEERRTLDESDGGWSLIAWRYLLFPQRSGERVIAGAKASGVAAKSRAERGGFDVAATDTVLNVRPSAFGANVWWIAARDLALRDEWSADPTKLAAGDEVERTITVEAIGVLPEQIPDVAPGETRGLTITPLGVARKLKVVGDQAQGSAAFHYRVRALSPVPVFLDTVRVRWWNTVENRADESIIPARRIDIAVPDRSALVDNALARESAWDRLLDRAGRMEIALFVAFAGLLAVLAVASARLGIFDGLSDRLKRARMRREIRQLAGRGDAVGLHARIRQLSHDPALGARLRPARVMLEENMFAASDGPSVEAAARLTVQALQQGRAGASSFAPL